MLLEPYMFARFKEAELCGELVISGAIPIILIKDDGKIDPESEEVVADFLYHSTKMRRIVQILLCPLVISSLRIKHFAVHAILDFDDDKDFLEKTREKEAYLLRMICSSQLALEQRNY